jgi:hypothetical protein
MNEEKLNDIEQNTQCSDAFSEDDLQLQYRSLMNSDFDLRKQYEETILKILNDY